MTFIMSHNTYGINSRLNAYHLYCQNADSKYRDYLCKCGNRSDINVIFEEV